MRVLILAGLVGFGLNACAPSSDINPADLAARSSSSSQGSGIVVTPKVVSLDITTSQQFNVSGGAGGYTYSIGSGCGSISSTGLYIAPATAVTACLVTISDQSGASVTASITVTSSGAPNIPQALTVNYSPLTDIAGGGTVTFTVSGGTPGYVYVVDSGDAIFAGNVLTMGATAGTVAVHVSDSAPAMATRSFTLTNTGTPTACAANSVAACSDTGGTGVMTCAADGSGYSACSLTSCNLGLQLRNGICTNQGRWVALSNRNGVSCSINNRIDPTAACTLGSSGCGVLSYSNHNGEIDSMFSCQ